MKSKKKKLGRKPKYAEKTTVIAFRVPVSKKIRVTITVNAMLSEWIKKS